MPTARAVVTIAHPALGGTGTNTWHLRNANVDLSDAGEFEDLMGYVKTFYEVCGSVFPNGTNIAWNGELAGVGDDEGTYWQADPWTVAGQSNTPVLPPATAICVNWRGQSGDRSRRGRTFLGPIASGNLQDDGTIVNASLTTIRGAAADVVESSDSYANGAVGVWSRQESVFRDFVSSSVRDQFAVLRSRRD